MSSFLSSFQEPNLDLNSLKMFYGHNLYFYYQPLREALSQTPLHSDTTSWLGTESTRVLPTLVCSVSVEWRQISIGKTVSK